MNKNETIRIAIAGDCSNWNQRNVSKIDVQPAIIENISECDVFIFNLEGPLINSDLSPKSPIESFLIKKTLKRLGKLSPPVTSSEDILDILNLTKSNIACLANNHILDAGEEGIDFTLEALKRKGFFSIGAGKNIHDAAKNLILEIKGKKIGILNYNFVGWNKFGIFVDPLSASKKHAGTNSGNKRRVREDIEKILKHADFTIVIMHMGRQLKNKLSDKEMKFLQSLQVDIVVVHHSHIFQILESKKIFSTGDFIFNFPEQLPDRREGAIIYLECKNKTTIIKRKIKVVQGKPVLMG